MMVRDWSMGADENEEEEKQSENVKENTVFQHMVRPTWSDPHGAPHGPTPTCRSVPPAPGRR